MGSHIPKVVVFFPFVPVELCFWQQRQWWWWWGDPTQGHSLMAGKLTYSREVAGCGVGGPGRGSVTFVELQLPELMLKGSCCLFSAFSMTQDWRLGDRDGISV